MLGRPLTSTLFPYTTLFRSGRDDAHADGRHRPAPARQPDRVRQRRLPRPDRVQSDRKSTRLNSSHVSISYAVFCSKKKNLNTQKDNFTLSRCFFSFFYFR